MSINQSLKVWGQQEYLIDFWGHVDSELYKEGQQGGVVDFD